MSWAYVFEWPAFAIYAIYMWWQLIHDRHTAFDKLWAAKQHAAADASGTPLYEIPGWALDKTLYREVVDASLEAANSPALSVGQTRAFTPPELGDGRSIEGIMWPTRRSTSGWRSRRDGASPVIDPRIVDVKVHVDEELNAYNRYLGELSWRDPPKHWGSGWSWGRRGTAKVSGAPVRHRQIRSKGRGVSCRRLNVTLRPRTSSIVGDPAEWLRQAAKIDAICERIRTPDRRPQCLQ